MADYRIYQAKVSVLTPLHIGSGHALLNEYDYAIYNKQTWRINEDELLDAQEGAGDPAFGERLAAIPPAGLLSEPDFQAGSKLFRYVIAGTPRAKGEGAEVQEQLKDARDQPYLPGTTLKGALRTAIGWYAWGKLELQPSRSQLGRDRRFAAQAYEREIFGRDPNHDALRALQVGDSAPVSTERLMLVNARVLNRGGTLGSPIEIEAVRPDTVFELTVKLDMALFSEWAVAHRLELQGSGALTHLPQVVQEYSLQRLQSEAAWLRQIPTAGKVAQYCQELAEVNLPKDAFLLQLGWGTGWEGKTFGSRLQADRDFMEAIVQGPREGGYGLARGRRHPGDPFPKSRRVLVQVQRAADGSLQETPRYPVGWVLVEMQEA